MLILLGILVSLWLGNESSKVIAKDKNSFLPWTRPKIPLKSYKGRKYFTHKSVLYSQSNKDKVFFCPFWVPLVRLHGYLPSQTINGTDEKLEEMFKQMVDDGNT